MELQPQPLFFPRLALISSPPFAVMVCWSAGRGHPQARAGRLGHRLEGAGASHCPQPDRAHTTLWQRCWISHRELLLGRTLVVSWSLARLHDPCPWPLFCLPVRIGVPLALFR